MKKKLIVLGILAGLVLSSGIALAVWNPPYLYKTPYTWYSRYAWDGRRMMAVLYWRLLTHTHNGGFEQGRPIGTAGLANGAVTGSKLNDYGIVVVIPAGQTFGATSLPNELINNVAIIGYVPIVSTVQVRHVYLGTTPEGPNREIAVELNATPTEENSFEVLVLKVR